MPEQAVDRDPTRDELEHALVGRTLETATRYLAAAGLPAPERCEDACDSFFLELAFVHANGRTYKLHLENGTVQFVTVA